MRNAPILAAITAIFERAKSAEDARNLARWPGFHAASTLRDWVPSTETLVAILAEALSIEHAAPVASAETWSDADVERMARKGWDAVRATREFSDAWESLGESIRHQWKRAAVAVAKGESFPFGPAWTSRIPAFTAAVHAERDAILAARRPAARRPAARPSTPSPADDLGGATWDHSADGKRAALAFAGKAIIAWAFSDGQWEVYRPDMGTAFNRGMAPEGTLPSAKLAAVSELRCASVLPSADTTPAMHFIVATDKGASTTCYTAACDDKVSLNAGDDAESFGFTYDAAKVSGCAKCVEAAKGTTPTQGSDGRPMLTEWRDDEVIVGGFGREIVDGNRNAGLLVFPADDGSERWTWRVYSHDGPSRGRHQIVADGFEPDPDSAKRAADNCDARKRLYRLPASPAPKPDPAGGDATIEGKPDHDCPHPYGRVFVSLTDGDGWALDGFSGPIVACPFCGARLAAPDSPTAANAPAPRTDAPIATIDLITAYAEHASNDCDGNCGFEDEDGKPKPDPACPEGVRLAAAVTASPTDAERSERFPGSVGARATGDGLRKALRRLRREPVECDRGNSSAFTDYGYRCVECSAEAADVESIEHAEDCRLIIIDRALAAAPVGGAREEKEPTKCDECGFLVGDGFECDHFIDGRDRAVAGKGTP